MKNTKIKSGILFFCLFSIALVLIEKYYYVLEPFSIDRFVLGMIVNSLFTFCIVFGIKKTINYIYKYRYICFVFIILYLLIMNYNTSNINAYDSYIQPNLSNEKYQPIFGKTQSIRSDEWGVSTPTKISQSINTINFSKTNDILMGKSNIVSLYPKLATKTYFNVASPSLIGYLLLPVDRGLSFDNFFEWVLLIFVTFDFCMIITNNKKKYSVLGSILIGLSPALIWWNSFQIILYGELAILFVNNLLKAKKIKMKIIWSLLLGWSGACYIMTMYPAWMIPYGYVFLALLIYVIAINSNENRFWQVLLYFLLAIAVIALLVIPNIIQSGDIVELISNTSYPGARSDTGKSPTWFYLFNYIGTIFYSIKEVGNPSELSQFICFFPIPILMGIGTIFKNIKNKKIDWLNILLLGTTALLLLYVFFDVGILAKITMLTSSTTKRAQVTIGYISVLLLLRNLALNEKKEKIFSVKNFILLILAIIISVILIKIYNYYFPEYLGRIMIKAVFLFLVFCIGLMLMNNEKLNKYLVMGMGFPLIIVGIIILPISKGIYIMKDKPAAQKIQEIVFNDNKGIWITAEESFVVSNYLVANGAPTLNSTNYYPNFELWNKFEDFEKYYEQYNRYAHIQISILPYKEKSNLELMQEDLLKLNLSTSDMERLNIKYIFTQIDLDKYTNTKIKFNKLYQEDNVLIYEVLYS